MSPGKRYAVYAIKPATLTAADCVARAFASLGSDASTKAVRRG